MTGVRMNKTTVYIPADVQGKLRQLSKVTGKAQAALIREALERYVEQAEPPYPTSIGAGEDRELQASDTAAWLRDNWRP